MADILNLSSIIDSTYHTEINDVLDKLKNSANPNILTIEELSRKQPSQVGSIIQSLVGAAFKDDLFNTTIENRSDTAAAQLTLDDYIVGNYINNPQTPLEKSKVDTVWEYFLNLYEGKRRGLIEYLANSYQQNVPFSATDNAFFLFAEQDQIFFERDYLTNDFYVAYADYLIFEAQRYLRVKRRTYMAIGRIVEDDNDQMTTGTVPVGNAKITVISATGVSIGGETRTDHNGYYNLYFSSLQEETGSIRLDISIEKEGYTTTSSFIEYEVNEPEKVLATEITSNPTTTSKILGPILAGMPDIPQEVDDFLANNGITRLSGIREHGLLINQDSLKDFYGNDDLQKLDGLAVLELVGDNVSHNNALYTDGYTNFLEVAAKPRSEFIEEYKGTLGSEYEAMKYHETASRLAMTAVNEMTPLKDGLTPETDNPDLVSYDECGCGNCESAVGPMAYLADLLSFSTEKLVYTTATPNPDPVDTTWLKDNLHRDFGEIPIACGELENNLCQARIATEALQANWIEMEPSAPQSINFTLIERSREYLIHTYKAILINIGTTYEELQSYQSVTDADDRRRYANRIGIVLTDSGTVTIEDIYRDISTSGQVTIGFLKTRFGLRDSKTTDPSPESKFEDWKRKRLVEIWEERDHVDTPYSKGEKVIIDPDYVTVDDFRKPETGNNPFDIWVERRNFLDIDVYAVLEAATGQPTKVRSISELLETGTFTYDGEPVPVNWPAGSFAGIVDELNTTAKTVEEKTDELWTTYALKYAEATKLAELDRKETETPSEFNDEDVICAANIFTAVVKRKAEAIWLTEESDDDIELSSKDFWVSERSPVVGNWPVKKDINVPLIDPELITLAGLPENTFQALEFTGTTPFELFTNRIDKLYGRIDGESSVLKELEAKTNLIQLVDYAFEGTNPQYQYNTGPLVRRFTTINDALNDPTTSDQAIAIILDDLKITVDDFTFIMGLGTKHGLDNMGFETFEKERLFSLLTTSRKLFGLYPAWSAAEGNTEYWKLRKAQLPEWRTSVQERNEWINALHEHNEEPVINADLIGPAYLVDPVAGNAAFDLWLERYNDMYGEVEGDEGWYAKISESDFYTVLQNNANFEFLIQTYLMAGSGITIDELENRKTSGEDISKALEQLGISSSDFNFLIDAKDTIRSNVDPPPNPDTNSYLSENQRERLAYMLARIQKKRKNYRYRLEEKSDGITQSPDYFVTRDTDYFTYPPTLPYPLNEFLVSEAQLSDWRKTVSSREDEAESSVQEYAAMLLDVDDETLPFLRDALVLAIFDTENSTLVNLSLSEKARKLGDKLLIDLQDNCCTKTNRVAQAIETMQQLIWKSHTEDILSDYPGMVLNVDSFDTIWQWMGSYANWRASMFVYLYPENILLPSLKKESTAGFRTILENTQNNRNFNPYQACEVSNDFREYLKDVSRLKLKYSAQTRVVTQKEDKCAGFDQTIENLTFVFATTENSGKSYYMTIKSTEEGHSQRTSWKQVPNIPDNALLKGADVYESESRGINYIYLFYMLFEDESSQSFYVHKFNANENNWESESSAIKVEAGELYNTTTSWYELAENIDEDFSLVNVVVAGGSFGWDTPHLTITIKSDSDLYTFCRKIDWNGVELRKGDLWNLWIRFPISRYNFETFGYVNRDPMTAEIDKVVFRKRETQFSNPDWYFYEYYLLDKSGNIFYLYRNSLSGQQDLQILTGQSSTAFGATVFPDIRNIFAFDQTLPWFFLSDDSSQGDSEIDHSSFIWYAADYNDILALGDFFLNNKFSFSIPNRGSTNYGTDTPFIYQSEMAGSRITFSSIAYNMNNHEFAFGNLKIPLTPQFSTTPAFDPNLNQSARQLLKEKNQANLVANTISENPKLRLYSEEAYYYAPIEIALKLSDNGYYAEALKWFRMVYDYFAKVGERKIYYGLIQEEDFANLQDRVAEWYEDPLNPHTIAATRANSFTRFTMMSIANTLLAFANAEFTIDNSETVPRAREMYEDIIDLLGILETEDPCAKDEVIRELESYVEKDPLWDYKWQTEFRRLNDLSVSQSEFETLKSDIETILGTSQDQQVKFAAVQTKITTTKNGVPTVTLDNRISSYTENVNKRIGLSMNGGHLEEIFASGKRAAEANTTATLTEVTGFSKADLPSEDLKWLYDGSEAEQADSYKTNPVAKTQSREIREFSRTNPIEGYNNANPFPEIRLSGMPYLFCVNPNPMVTASLMMAHANLYKIHNCMNIAGMVRELNPFAAPTDATSGMPSIGVGGTLQIPGQASVAPTNYRYAYLVERAKQLVSFAQQMEGTLLQSLEKFDAESYSQLKAEQDLELAKANIKLQDLRVKEAESGKVLAELQKDRAQLQVDGLQEMIDEGLLSAETALYDNYTQIALLESQLASFEQEMNRTNALLNAVSAGGGHTAGISVAAAMAQYAFVSLIGSDIQSTQSSLATYRMGASINSLMASLQRRQQEWEFQKTIANQDVKIGSQQIKIADDRIRVVSQEREIADLQQQQAQATLDFLKTKFTNAELYEWMSGILEDVYSFFLQEATAMSKLAEQQLAFERQINLPSLIKSDYWNINANNSLSLTGGDSPDRKGLTGSARLLRDLSELEIYAQDTNQRKLQITKVMSLNEHDPVEMENFRSTGVLSFATTHRDFDWDHPGQYLRTIRRVSVTVIALTPPTEGIKATLINNGISSVITSTNNLFQTKVIARTPERIVLSSPYNEYGVFQLDTNDTMYRPFEGSGVETLWELRMEKAANPFDYRSIADVLLTIEYDALHSEQYSQITRAQLNQEDRTGSLVFSLRNDLPDQWYELMNSDGSGLSSSFEVRNADLAPNVLSNKLTKVKVYASFDREKMTDDEMSDTDSITGSFIVSKGEEIVNDGIGAKVEINQLLLNSLYDFQGFPGIEEEIQGEWHMHFTETTKVLEMIEKGHLRDLILIIEYSADRVPFIINGNA